MHSVDLLEEALNVAIDAGFDVRQEWLQEKGGGACRIGKQWILFVDLSTTAQEQLEQVVQGLQASGKCQPDASMSRELQRLLSQAASPTSRSPH